MNSLRHRDFVPVGQKPGLGYGRQVGGAIPAVGAWKFAEGCGTKCPDASLYGNHGNLVGGAARVVGPDGHGILINGAGQAISIPHSPSLMPATQEVTVIVRLKMLAAPAQYDVIAFKTTSDGWGDGYGVFWNSATQAQFWVSAYNHAASITLDPLRDNIIVGTYSSRPYGGGGNSQARIWSGGIEGTPYDLPGWNANTASLEIGRSIAGGVTYRLKNGVIAYMQVYPYALHPDHAKTVSQGIDPWAWVAPMGPPRLGKVASGTAWTKSLLDSVILSDARNFLAGFRVTDLLSLVDSRSASAGFAKTCTDAFSLADSRTASVVKSLVEQLLLTDTRIIVVARKITESLALGDARTVAFARLCSETFGITDLVTAAIAGVFIHIVNSRGLGPFTASRGKPPFDGKRLQ